MIHQAMLMAAGLGTRLRPFTDLEPKALLPVLGIPTAQFALDGLVHANVSRIVANVHHLADRAQAGLHALSRGNATLSISDESQLLLGSAGGYKKALSLLKPDAFFAVNADVLCDVDLNELAQAHQRLKSRWGVTMTLAISRAGPPGGKYREILLDPSSGLIRGLGAQVEERPFYVGTAVMEPEAFSKVPDSQPSEFVPSVLEPAIREGRAGAFLCSGHWYDVGNPALWLGTHLELIDALEDGKLYSNPVSKLWANRIEALNARRAQKIWTPRKMPRYFVNMSEWSGPCYWNPLDDETVAPPKRLGPNAAVYGVTPDGKLENGVGFRGVWSQATSTQDR